MEYICGGCGSGIEAKRVGPDGTATCPKCGVRAARDTAAIMMATVALVLLGASIIWRGALAQIGIPVSLVLAAQGGLMLALAVTLPRARRLGPMSSPPHR